MEILIDMLNDAERLEGFGFVLVAENAPCPLPGAEAGEVVLTWNGRSARWVGGKIYARTVTLEEQKKVRTWVQALEEKRKI